MTVSNISVNDFMARGLQQIDNMGAKLDQTMNEITQQGEELSQEDLLNLQYEMGQYNAFITAMNNTVSAIQGQLKEMANSIR